MIDHPRATIAALLAALATVVLFPEQAVIVELIAVPIVVVAAVVSVAYLIQVYVANPIGVIWKHIVGNQITTLPLVLWVGYLTVVRIASTLHAFIPAPSPVTSAPITGLLLILAITPSIRYAIAVYQLRRSATGRDDVTAGAPE